MKYAIEKKSKKALNRPRNALMAFVFSLAIPGLGQVYNGQLKKGAIFLGFIFFLHIVFGVTRAVTYFYGLLLLLIIEILFRIYIIIDGVVNAKRQKEYTLKPYNKWYYYLLISIGMVIILMVYDTQKILGIQTFEIPSTANSPTVQAHDLIVADLRAYKNSEPDYGDMVVFSGSDGEIHTFRVVGKPNDILEVIDNVVTINNRQSKSTFIRETIEENIPVIEFEEELPNGHKHSIYKFKQPYNTAVRNIKDIVIPPDNYYLLGDNRDNAADSRYKGFISRDSIKGQIVYSFWGQSTDRVNIDFR
ncbi:MAG: signal peptidase I [Bacteroidota bacterium]